MASTGIRTYQETSGKRPETGGKRKEKITKRNETRDERQKVSGKSVH
jgi:hypothetical protein